MSRGWVGARAGGGRHLLSRADAGLGTGTGVLLGLSTKPKGPSWSSSFLETSLLPEASQLGHKDCLKAAMI